MRKIEDQSRWSSEWANGNAQPFKYIEFLKCTFQFFRIHNFSNRSNSISESFCYWDTCIFRFFFYCCYGITSYYLCTAFFLFLFKYISNGNTKDLLHIMSCTFSTTKRSHRLIISPWFWNAKANSITIKYEMKEKKLCVCVWV